MTGEPAAPTASQKDAPAHETEFRTFEALPTTDTLGVETIDQAVPFHASARVTVALACVASPTAVHDDALTQETPLSTLSVEAVGFGEATIVHALPFHCSTRVSVLEVEVRWALPTATHQFAPRHDTEESVVCVEPVGLGLGTTAQAEPFHARASVPELVDPTAVQKLGPAHETPSSMSLVVEGWLGLLTIDQAVPFHCSISVAPVAVVTWPTATQKDELTQVTPER